MSSVASRIKQGQRTRLVRYGRAATNYDRDMELFETWILGTDHRGRARSRAIGVTLEVAIGTGHNLPEYPADLTLIGVDLSPDMLALARARAQQLDRAVELLETNSQGLPFPDNSFDTVVCTYALCTVPDDGSSSAR